MRSINRSCCPILPAEIAQIVHGGMFATWNRKRLKNRQPDGARVSHAMDRSSHQDGSNPRQPEKIEIARQLIDDARLVGRECLHLGKMPFRRRVDRRPFQRRHPGDAVRGSPSATQTGERLTENDAPPAPCTSR